MTVGLEGRVAIVTGASRGIGEATARELAQHGCKVVVTARGAKALDRVASSISESGGEAASIAADMANLDDLERLVSETRVRFGGVDILVNNAGVLPPARQIYHYSPDEWEQVMAVNLRGPWYLSKLVHPLMKERGGGAIVNVSTTSGLHHDIGLGLYGISKAALVFLSIACAKEWARDNIRVNCIAPGVVQTELARPVLQYLAGHNQKPNPLNMIGEPEDVARLIRFLVSEESRYVTGDVIRIDGGELL